MKHIILYGPSAVGKLTVGTALSELTDYPLVHNHLTINMVREIFPMTHPEFANLVTQFRGEIFEAAARSKMEGLISTLVYVSGGEDDRLLKDWMKRVARHHGETLFVRLHCSPKTLFKRVGNASRKAAKKIATAKKLRYWLQHNDLLSPIPFVASLEIDTDHLKPKEAAKLIKKHYHL
jgi:chloramphenicol 3-O-phosphotransferase